MVFKAGDDPNRNKGGRPLNSKGKKRNISDWDALGDKTTVKAIDVGVIILRQGSEAGKRDIAIELLTAHRKILDGKAEAPAAVKAILLKHSAEAADTLKGFLTSRKTSESTKKMIVKFFIANSMEKLLKEDVKVEDKGTDVNAPVISLAMIGGKKPEKVVVSKLTDEKEDKQEKPKADNVYKAFQ